MPGSGVKPRTAFRRLTLSGSDTSSIIRKQASLVVRYENSLVGRRPTRSVVRKQAATVVWKQVGPVAMQKQAGFAFALRKHVAPVVRKYGGRGQRPHTADISAPRPARLVRNHIAMRESRREAKGQGAFFRSVTPSKSVIPAHPPDTQPTAESFASIVAASKGRTRAESGAWVPRRLRRKWRLRHIVTWYTRARYAKSDRPEEITEWLERQKNKDQKIEQRQGEWQDMKGAWEEFGSGGGDAGEAGDEDGGLEREGKNDVEAGDEGGDLDVEGKKERSFKPFDDERESRSRHVPDKRRKSGELTGWERGVA